MTDQGKSRWIISKEPHIKMTDLAGIPDIKVIFDRYRIGWMGEPSRSYSPKHIC